MGVISMYRPSLWAAVSLARAGAVPSGRRTYAVTS